jgi:hypothetical protein
LFGGELPRQHPGQELVEFGYHGEPPIQQSFIEYSEDVLDG